MAGLEQHHVAMVVRRVGKLADCSRPGGFIGKVNAVHSRQSKWPVLPLTDHQGLCRAIDNLFELRLAIAVKRTPRGPWGLAFVLVLVQIGCAEVGDVEAMAYRSSPFSTNPVGDTSSVGQRSEGICISRANAFTGSKIGFLKSILSEMFFSSINGSTISVQEWPSALPAGLLEYL